MLTAISNPTYSKLNCSCHSLQELKEWLLHSSSFLAKNHGPIFDYSVSLYLTSYPSVNLSSAFKIHAETDLFVSNLVSIVSPLCYRNFLLTGLPLLSLSTYSPFPQQPVWAFCHFIWVIYFLYWKTSSLSILLRVKARDFKLLLLMLPNWMSLSQMSPQPFIPSPRPFPNAVSWPLYLNLQLPSELPFFTFSSIALITSWNSINFTNFFSPTKI